MMTPDGVTAPDWAMHAVSAVLAVLKFGLFAAESHAAAEQTLVLTQSRPGRTVLERNSLVNGPTALTSTSTCVGLSTLIPVIGASPAPTPEALKAM